MTDLAKALLALDDAAGLAKAQPANAPAKPPKEYREGGATERGDYADPANYKYPIDTEKHVRAALGYFSKPKNAAVYSTAEQKAIWKRIRAAAKKFDIEIGEESGPPSVQKSDTVAVPLIKHLDSTRNESPLDWLDNFMGTPLEGAAGEVVKRHCALLAAKARRDAEQPTWQERQAMDPVARAQCEAECERADAAATRERHEIEAQMHDLEGQLVDLCCEAAKGSYDANLARAIRGGEILPGAPHGELIGR